MEGNEICVDRAKPEDLPDMLRLLESLFSLEADFSFDATRQRRGLEMLLRQGARRAQLLADQDNGSALGFYAILGWRPSNMRMLRMMIEPGNHE